MKKITLLIALVIFSCVFAFAQSRNTKIFTIFTSSGCGCTGSGGPPETFTTNEEVFSNLQKACTGINFIEFKGTVKDAYNEVQSNKNSYDGVLIVGQMGNDFRLAFTGLPTIIVYNLFEFQGQHPYHAFATGKFTSDDGSSILNGGSYYKDVKILTAQLDRRNLSAPSVTKFMFNDLVYKVKLIQVIKELKETKILMIKHSKNEIISSVNYRGDFDQSFPEDHNDRYIHNLKKLLGTEIVLVEPKEFYEEYQNTSINEAEKVADKWIEDANKVIASRSEIVKNARAYLAFDALREKYNCNAVSTHIRTLTGSGKLEDQFWPGLGLELGFKPRGIMAVCQNYPDILLSQVLAYSLTGKPSMLGDQIYDIDNGVEIVLHCGIPVNPYGDEWKVPYIIVPHAQSPIRDKPDQSGSATGLRAQWPVNETVTFWEIHTQLGQIRLHTGKLVDGHNVYTGGEDIDHVMCTSKIIANVENIEKVRDQHSPYLYGIHHCVTIGDLRQQIKDIGVLLGMDVIERDK
jgi:hypothetical protein